MSDTVKINSIDQTQIENGYVTVATTITIAEAAYTPDPFVINAVNPVDVTAGVQQQAEIFKSSLATAQASGINITTLNTLIGETIDL